MAKGFVRQSGGWLYVLEGHESHPVYRIIHGKIQTLLDKKSLRTFHSKGFPIFF